MSAKIRKGDLVCVIAGAEKGKEGRVIRVLPKKRRVWVENVRIISRHTKAVSGQSEGGIIKKEAPIDISNVMLIDPSTKQPTRVGFKFVFDVSEEEQARMKREGQMPKGRKVRFAKASGTVIED